MYFLPALYLTPLAVKNLAPVKKLFANKKLAVLLACVLGVIAYFFQLSAYMLTEVSNVFPLIQLSTLVAVIGGVCFHKEKELGLRLVGAASMIVGSCLISRPEVFNFLLQG